jgi:hypothetical protein
MCIFERFEMAFEEGEAPTLVPKCYTSDELARGNPPSVPPPQQELYHCPKAKGGRPPKLSTPRKPPQLHASREQQVLSPREHPSQPPSANASDHPSGVLSPPHILQKDPVLIWKEMPSPPPKQSSYNGSPPCCRNPERTQKHQGINRLVPHLDSQQTYGSSLAMLDTDQNFVPAIFTISAFLLAENLG